jgi:hypothetical protein
MQKRELFKREDYKPVYNMTNHNFSGNIYPMTMMSYIQDIDTRAVVLTDRA